jgi:hypothetical protein
VSEERKPPAAGPQRDDGAAVLQTSRRRPKGAVIPEPGRDGSPPAATTLATTADVARLAEEILDPRRAQPVVCATSPSWSSEPLVDVAALQAALGGAARLYVMPTGDLSWELAERLPPRLDVYGGAIRVWWPGVDHDADPQAHPLFFVRNRGESGHAIDRIVETFRREGLVADERPAPLELGAETGAVVTAVRDWGAELTLTGAEPAFAHRRELTGTGLEPARVVRPGQSVRVRIVRRAPEHERVGVTLLPFEPDPWQRLAEQYAEGALVEGIVSELRNFGAFVEVYPGLRGLVHRSQISTEWVSHPEDVLEPGERVVVRLVRVDPGEGRIDLRLLDVPEDAEAQPPAAVYPDGPPWLAPLAEPAAPEPEPEPEPTAAAGPAAPEAAAEEPEPAAAEEPRADELDELERAVEDARELQRHVGALFDDAERRLHRLRAEASQVRQLLERDLAEVRLRLLEFAESETAAIAGSTESVLAEARAEAEELRAQLAAAEADRRELLERLRAERGRSEDAAQRATRLRGELRAERDSSARRERELEALDPAGDRRFLADVRHAWERQTTGDDRRRFPWREPVLGPAFLESVASVHGVARDRVAEVSAHVASGRAAEIPGLELHPLRVTEAGGAPQREREDGAKAWRCSLQASTPAARRLHYWTLPGGGVELAKVVYHDDYSIA